jgi:hypothetical protein
MNTMGRLLFKLFLAFFGLLLMLGMLLFLLVYIVWATLRWLLTGQKPQVAVVWQRYRDMRRGLGAQAEHPRDAQDFEFSGRSAGRYTADDQVIDVDVREVESERPSLPPRSPRG